MRLKWKASAIIIIVGCLMLVGYQNCGQTKSASKKNKLSPEELKPLLYDFWGEPATGLTSSQKAKNSNTNSKTASSTTSNPMCSNGTVAYTGFVLRVNCADYDSILSLVGSRFKLNPEFWQNPQSVELGADARVIKLSLSGVNLGPVLTGRIPEKLEVLSLGSINANKINVVWNNVLRELDLSNNMLSDAEIQRQVLPKTLTHLNLSGNLLNKTSTYLDRNVSYADVSDNPLCGEGDGDSPHVTCQKSTHSFLQKSGEDDCSGWEFSQVEIENSFTPQKLRFRLTASTARACVMEIRGRSYCFYRHAWNGTSGFSWGGLPPVTEDEVRLIPATFDALSGCAKVEGAIAQTPTIINYERQMLPTVSFQNPTIRSFDGYFSATLTVTMPPLSSYFDSRACYYQINCDGVGGDSIVLNGSVDALELDRDVARCRGVSPGKAKLRGPSCYYTGRENIGAYSSTDNDISIAVQVNAQTDSVAYLEVQVEPSSSEGTPNNMTVTYSSPLVGEGRPKGIRLRLKNLIEAPIQHFNHLWSSPCIATGYNVSKNLTVLADADVVLVDVANCQEAEAVGEVLFSKILANNYHATPPPSPNYGNVSALVCSAVPNAPAHCQTEITWNIQRIEANKTWVLFAYDRAGQLILNDTTGTGRIHCVDRIGTGTTGSINWVSAEVDTFEFQALDSCEAPADRSKRVASTQAGWGGCAEQARITLESVGTDEQGHCAIPEGQSVCSPAPKLRLNVEGNMSTRTSVVVRTSRDGSNIISPTINTTAAGHEVEINSIAERAYTFRPYVLCSIGTIREIDAPVTITGTRNVAPPPPGVLPTVDFGTQTTCDIDPRNSPTPCPDGASCDFYCRSHSQRIKVGPFATGSVRIQAGWEGQFGCFNSSAIEQEATLDTSNPGGISWIAKDGVVFHADHMVGADCTGAVLSDNFKDFTVIGRCAGGSVFDGSKCVIR